MILGMDFSINYPVAAALIVSVILPCVLFIVTKIPKLAGRNPIQFFLTYLISTIAWLMILMYDTHYDFESYIVSFCLYHGMVLGYLEIWGLLSRGYTLGLLLTFYKAKKPLTMIELSELYRGGEGLGWLIKHRFAGLEAANMITVQDGRVCLTRRGAIVAFIYKQLLWFFGLRCSG